MEARLLQLNQANFHGTPLRIAWIGLSNLAIIMMAFRWSKYTFYMHLWLNIVIIVLTALAIIPSLQGFI